MHLFDESFWLLICFLIFLAIIYRPIRKNIIHVLDNRIETIKQQLDVSKALRNEAAELLEKTKIKLEQLTNSKVDVIAKVNENVERSSTEHKEAFENFLRNKKDEVIKTITYEKQLVIDSLQEEFLAIVNDTVIEYIKNSSISDIKVMNNIKKES